MHFSFVEDTAHVSCQTSLKPLHRTFSAVILYIQLQNIKNYLLYLFAFTFLIKNEKTQN